MVVGNDPGRIERAVSLEIAGERRNLPLSWLFAALGAAFAAAAFVSWRGKVA